MQQLVFELSWYLSQVLGGDIALSDSELQIPPKKELWDLCIWLFQFMKTYKVSPGVLCDWITCLHKENNTSVIESLTLTGPYLNITLKKSYYWELFREFYIWKKYYNTRQKGGVAIVDYIWANVWKPMHIGHICTPLQWQSCINVLRKIWYTVIWDSHIWDWGIIFWKLIVWYWKYWIEEKLQQDAVEHLFDIYVKISADAEKNQKLEQDFRDAFRLLSSGEQDSIDLWKKFTSSSIDTMNTLLNRLFVYPDYNIGESFYEWLNLPKLENYPDLTYSMHDIVEELIEKWIATKNEDNSVWVLFSEYSKLSSCILQKRDGTHGYLASDLACIRYRIENWNPERIIYFVDVRQQLHFKQAFEIAKQAWWLWDTYLSHAHNGFISLKEWAMSTRKWRIIKLSKLLDEAHERAKNIIVDKRGDLSDENLTHLSEIVGIWAVKYWYLKKSRELDSIFDWDDYMSFEWNSWPYLQYAYVRAKKILQNTQSDDFNNLTYKFIHPRESQFIQKLFEYPKIVDEISKNYNVHQLCLYMYELTKVFSAYYSDVEILRESQSNIRESRLALLSCFTEILEEWFSILWIELPDEM